MPRLIVEAVGLALAPDSRVDMDAGIIRGVKVLGSQSRNGRVYPPALLKERHTAYEEAQVYSDHDYAQLKHGRARPMTQWGGVLRRVRFEGDSIRGDLECLKETTAGRVILEAAQRCPDKFGLSPMHLIDARKEPDGSETVTAILEVWSVDAVTRPATTKTLFEQDETMPDEPAPMPTAAAAPSIEDAFMALHTALMASADYDDNEKISMWKDMNKLKSKWLGTEEEEAPAEGEPPAGESEVRRPLGRQARELADIRSTLRALTIRQMAGESLPLDAPTMQLLLGLPDDNAVSTYLESLRRQRRPRYSSGPARSQGRTVAEAQGNRPQAVPRLTAGADREQVKKFYRS